MAKRIGVYKITNKLNGKVYIGQSIDIDRRWRSYKYHKDTRAGIRLNNAFKKYGRDGFIFEIIEELNRLDDLLKREQYWIEFYGSYKSNKGYKFKLI